MNKFTALAGIDVGKSSFSVALESPEGERFEADFNNDRKGIGALIEYLEELGCTVLAVLEATGSYGIDLARELWGRESVRVMLANPRKVRHFAGAMLQRSKTDRLDARVLLEFVRRMPFEPWAPPGAAAYRLRKHTRHLVQLKERKTQVKNQLSSGRADSQTPAWVINELKAERDEQEARIKRCLKRIISLIRDNEQFSRWYDLLRSIPGVGRLSGVCILGELATLPEGMGPRQWVAHSGLDPVQYSSGTSIQRATRISRNGNSYMRRALFYPALNGKNHKEHGWVLAKFRERLESRGLEKMQAITALMRKLLHTIYGVLKNDETFNPDKFGDFESS